MADIHLNRHFSTLRDYFCQLYQDQSQCDVSFITKNGTTVLAHKLVVSAFSGAVRAEVDRWKDLPQVSIVVDCDDSVLRGILEFVYTGKISVPVGEELIILLNACNGLQIPTLEKFIKEKVSERNETKHTDDSDCLNKGEIIDENKQKTVNGCESGDGNIISRFRRRSDGRKDKSHYTFANDEFVWSDEDCDDTVDDTDVTDETWQPDEKMKDSFPESRERSNKSNKLCKQAYIKLERINAKLNKTRSTASNSRSKIRSTASNSRSKIRSTASNSKSKIRSAASKSENKIRSTASTSEVKTRSTASKSESKIRSTASKSESKIRSTASKSESKIRSTASKSESKIRSTAFKSESKIGSTASKSESKIRSTAFKSESKIRSTASKSESHKGNEQRVETKNKEKWYTRENLTRLSKLKQKCNKYPRSFMKVFLKHSIKKIQHSLKTVRKKRLLVTTASKIVQRSKRFSCVKKNKIGYSCNICKFWNKYCTYVKIHFDRNHRNNKNILYNASKLKRIKKKTSLSVQKKKKIQRIKEKIRNFRCFKCEKKYTAMRGLATHLVEKHKFSFEKTQKLTGYPKYFTFQTEILSKCGLCQAEFHNLKEYRNHSRTVHKKKRLDPDIPCTYKGCKEKFYTVKALKEHLVKVHKFKNIRNITFKNGVHCQYLKQQNTIKNVRTEETESAEVGKKCGKKICVPTAHYRQNNSFGRKNNFKYKIFLPLEKFKCNICRTICRHKYIHKNHEEVSHKKIFMSSQFLSRLIVNKYLRYVNPLVDVAAQCQHSTGGSDVIVGKDKIVNDTKIRGKKTPLKCKKEISVPFESLVYQENMLSEQKLLTSDEELCRDRRENLTIGNVVSMGSDTFDEATVLPVRENEHLTDTSLNTLFVEPDLKNENKRCQSICWKCGLSFRYYCHLSRHFQRKHRKIQKSRSCMFSKIRKHVNMRKSLFSRKTILSHHDQVEIGSNDLRKTDCDVCNKSFSNLRNLASHLQTVHKYSYEDAREVTGYPVYQKRKDLKKKTIKCIICSDSFTHIRNLASHLQNKHKYTFEQAREATGYPSRISVFLPGKPTSCKICSKSFPSYKSCQKHRIEAHGVVCPYCKKTFVNKLSLKRHCMRIHLDKFDEFKNMKISINDKYGAEEEKRPEIEHQCANCDFTTKSIKNLTSHIIDYHPEVEHPCPQCGFSFRTTNSLQRHLEKHHGEGEKKKIVCKWCKKKFIRPCFLRVHAFKIHGIPHRSLKEFKCDFEGCRNISYTLNDLKSHKRNTHDAVRKFPCSQCNFIGHSRHRLLRHVRSIHLKLKPHLCDSCGKAFSSEGHMKEHIRRYHTNSYYQLQCEYCVYQCGRKHQLFSHMWHQHNIKMEDDHRYYYQCDRCSYQTPVKCKFNNHMNGHNNVRNYSCDQCDKMFITASTMRSHKKWKHSIEEDKVCNQCGYSTKTGQKLNEHIRVQHQLKGIKPYLCPYCDFTCATSGNCRKHIMGKHKGKEVRYNCDKEYLEVAKMARKEGNTNPLIVQVQNIQKLEPIVLPVEITQIIDPNYQQLVPAEPVIFDEFVQEDLC